MDSSNSGLRTVDLSSKALAKEDCGWKKLTAHSACVTALLLFAVVAVSCDNDELDAARLKYLLGGVESALDTGGTLDWIGTPDTSETLSTADTNDGVAEPPGLPFLVRATIEEEEVVAGIKVAVLCTVEDEFGNVLQLETTIDSHAGYEIDGTNVAPTIAGEYDITCSAVGMDGLDKVADHLVVTAGPVASVVMQAKPDKQAYQVGDKVEVTGSAADEYGNLVQGGDVAITAPEEMEKVSEGKYAFLDEGMFTFVGKLQEPYDHISGELILVCDQSGPVILLSEPKRAATLDGNKMVLVYGNVLDALCPTMELYINDDATPVDAEGNFVHELAASHGINILEVVAHDGFGNSSKIVQSVYYSSDYVDYATEKIDDALLEQSMLVFLGQNFLDDGNHDMQAIDDVGTVVQLLLDSLDMGLLGVEYPLVDTVIPGIVNMVLPDVSGHEFTLTGDMALVVYVEDVSFAKPWVSFNTREGGIDMTVSFSGTPDDPGIYVQLYVEIGLTLTVESTLDGDQPFQAGITPGVAVQSSLGIEIVLAETSFDIIKNVGEELSVQVANLDIAPAGINIESLQGLKIDLGPVQFNGQDLFVLPVVDLGALVSNVDDILSNYVIDSALNFVVVGALDLLEPTIEGPITTLLGDLLNQFEFELPVPIPELPGSTGPAEVTFKSKLSSVHFTPDGGELSLAAGFMAPKGVDIEVLGSLLRAGCLSGNFSTPEFDVAKKMEFAVHLDLLNELFFVLWWTGGLQLELDKSALGDLDLSDFGLADLTVAADFWLPPVLDDCMAKGMVEVHVGDLLVTMSFKLMGAPVTISIFVSTAMDATIIGEGDKLGLQILGITDIGTQIIDMEGDLGPLAGMFDIEELVDGVLVPMIIEQVTNLSLGSFPIPEVDLSTLVPGIPPGTTLSLGSLVVGITKGYLLGSGELL